MVKRIGFGYLEKLIFDVPMKKYVGKQGEMKEHSSSTLRLRSGQHFACFDFANHGVIAKRLKKNEDYCIFYM